MPQTEENIFPGFSKLKEALHLAKSSRSVKEVLDAIAVAFRPFSEETLLVKQAYIRLLKRYNDVNRELEESRNSLHEKVKQLERVTAYLDSILCNISEGIVFINKNGLITTYNLSAEKLLHHRAEDVLFKRYWDVFTDTTFGFSMKEALEGHTSSPLGYASYASEGKEEQELEISTSFVKASNKLQPGIILLIRDITERRNLQRQESLRTRLQELGELAAGVAHEIRNPLGGIEGFASLLCKDLKEMPQQARMATHIVEGSKTISRLVENVLSYARPLSPELKNVEISPLVKELMEAVEVSPHFSKNITISFNAQAEPLHAWLDRQMVYAALHNLLLNSCQSIKQVGTIQIELTKQENTLCLSITDSGEGIAPKHIEKIFLPFFTTKPQGTGLGLYETYKVIQSHGGTIDVRSRQSQGTTFTISLPIRG